MGGERKFEGVRASSESSIEIDFYYSGSRCKERLKLEPTPANLKRAAMHRASILTAIEAGTFDYATTFPNSKKAAKFAIRPLAVGVTISSYFETWLEGKKRKVKASTWDDYRKIVANPIRAHLGDIDIEKLRRLDVKVMCQKLDCSNKRLTNILSVLRSGLDEAVEDEILESNPIHDWTYQNADAIKKDDDVDPFTPAEQALILSKCEGQFQNLIKFAIWTGLRTSELAALDWGDIDWQRGVVVVSRALTQASNEAEDTKTRSGRREVKLLRPALEALQSQKPFTLLKNEEIFQNPRTGERWVGDQPIRQGPWQRAIRLSGVRYRRPYQTRHTYASMMLSAGEHPMWVAQQLGHKDWSMIRRVYGRFMPDAAPNAGSLAEQIFQNHGPHVDQTGQNSPDIPKSSEG